MKKLLLASLFLASCAYAEPLLVLEDFSAGKVDNYDATRIPNNSVYDTRNVYFDEDYPAQKRRGMSKLNSNQLGDGLGILSQFEYKMSDGTRYHIVHSSETVYYRLSGSEWTVLKVGNSATYPCNYVVFMDTLTVVDGVNDMWSWDTSTTFTQESTYQPRFVIVWQNRIWQAGDSDERSKVRCSEWLDPSDYTVPASPVYRDPAVFDINSQDGQKVMGFFLSPNGNLGILKEDSVWEIGGYDRSDFFLRMVINDMGCIDSGSVAYKEGVVSWLSEQGFVGYDGHTYSYISDDIFGTISEIQQLDFATGSFIKNSQPDWENFTSTENVTVSDSPGNVTNIVPLDDNYGRFILRAIEVEIDSSSSTHIIGSGTTDLFCYTKTIGGTISSTTIDTGNSAIININQNHFFDIDASDKKHVVYFKVVGSYYHIFYASATTGTWSTYDVANTSSVANNLINITNTIATDSSDNPHLIYGKETSDGEEELFYRFHDGTSWSAEIAWTGDNDDNFYIGALEIDSNNHLHLACQYWAGGVYSLYHISGSSGSASTADTLDDLGTFIANGIDIAIDSSNNSYISYWNFSTQVPQLTYLDTTWKTETIDSDVRLNGTAESTDIDLDSSDQVNVVYSGVDQVTMKYGVRDSASSWRNYTILSGEIGGVSMWPECSDIIMDFSDRPLVVYGGYESGEPIYIKLCASTATYISEVYDTGNTGTYYYDEAIIGETKNDYDTAHYLRSDDSTVNIATNTWTAFTSGAIPANQAKQYIQYKCVISTDIISNSVASIDRVTINYHGTAGSTYLSSMNYDGRVWNAVGISSATYLDRQLIWDTNNAWTDFTSGIGCRSLFNYNGTPYWGSDDGYIYTMDTGEIDGTDAIESWVLTKQYSMGSMIQQKTLDKMYVLADDSGNWDLNLGYRFDRSGVAESTFTIDLDQTANLINYKIPIDKQIPFYTVQFKLSNDNSNEPWSLLGLQIFGRTLPLR